MQWAFALVSYIESSSIGMAVPECIMYVCMYVKRALKRKENLSLKQVEANKNAYSLFKAPSRQEKLLGTRHGRQQPNRYLCMYICNSLSLSGTRCRCKSLEQRAKHVSCNPAEPQLDPSSQQALHLISPNYVCMYAIVRYWISCQTSSKKQ